MPCLGTYLPLKKIIALKPLYTSLTIWLDSDKWKEARDIAEAGKQIGLSTNTIYTELDPKVYSDKEIYSYLKHQELS